MLKLQKELQKGDIYLISRTKSRGGLDFLQVNILIPAIRWFCDVEYHHAGVLDYYNGELYCWECMMNGFVPTQPAKALLDVDYKVLIYDNVADRDWDVKMSFLKYTGYDFGSLFFYQAIDKLAFKIGLKGLWLGRKNILSLQRTYCTEIPAYLLNIHKFWKADPKVLHDYCVANLNLKFSK